MYFCQLRGHLTTIGAQTTYQIVKRRGAETFGQRNWWNWCLAKTKCPLTAFAIKMYMLVIGRTFAFAVADFIFQSTASVFDTMNEMMLQQKRECTKDCAAVGCYHPFFYLAQREGPTGVCQLLVHQNTHGCGPHASLSQNRCYLRVCHISIGTNCRRQIHARAKWAALGHQAQGGNNG